MKRIRIEKQMTQGDICRKLKIKGDSHYLTKHKTMVAVPILPILTILIILHSSFHHQREYDRLHQIKGK